MAARKLSRAHLMTASEVAVIIEDFRGQFRVFGEALQGLVAKVDGLETRFDGLEGRFDGLEGRFDGLETRFDRLEGRFDGLETRFDRLESTVERLANHDIPLLKIAVLDNSRETKELRRFVEAGLAKKVDRDELEAILASRDRRR